METSDFVTDRPLMGGRVKRYHTWAVHHSQTVGEHSWQVARIYEELFGPLSSEVERYIRLHDVTEVVVGDPPFPVKKDSPVLKEEYARLDIRAMRKLGLRPLTIDPLEQAKVKICDLLEMMEFGMVEREMGNLLAVPIVLRTERVARSMAASISMDISEIVDQYVEDQWKRHQKVLIYGEVDIEYNQDQREKL